MPGVLATAAVKHPWSGALGIFKPWLVFAARFLAHNSGIFAFSFQAQRPAECHRWAEYSVALDPAIRAFSVRVTGINRAPNFIIIAALGAAELIDWHGEIGRFLSGVVENWKGERGRE